MENHRVLFFADEREGITMCLTFLGKLLQIEDTDMSELSTMIVTGE